MTDQALILVVDDDHRIAAALRRTLVYEGYRVELSHDGGEAVGRVGRSQPDLVLLDWMLPGLSGLEVCRQVRSVSDVPVLMITARDAVTDRVAGLDQGADDYLVKPFAEEELLARVRALLRRRGPVREESLSFEDLVVDLAGHQVTRTGKTLHLTAQEFALLVYFVRNRRVVLTRAQILAAVWGIDWDVTSNVVDVYVGYLRAKLEEGGARRLIQTVRGVGYVLRSAVTD